MQYTDGNEGVAGQVPGRAGVRSLLEHCCHVQREDGNTVISNTSTTLPHHYDKSTQAQLPYTAKLPGVAARTSRIRAVAYA